MKRTRLTLFIQSAQLAEANAWMREHVDPTGDSFTAPLTSDGVNVTHYWCSGLWSGPQAAAILGHFGADAQEGSPIEALSSAGLSVWQSEG